MFLGAGCLYGGAAGPVRDAHSRLEVAARPLVPASAALHPHLPGTSGAGSPEGAVVGGWILDVLSDTWIECGAADGVALVRVLTGCQFQFLKLDLRYFCNCL